MYSRVMGYRFYYSVADGIYKYDDFKSEYRSNGNRRTEGWLTKPDGLERKVLDMNAKLVAGELIPSKCSDCKRPYMLTKSEARFFTENNLSLPTRCIPCRKRKSKKRAKSK